MLFDDDAVDIVPEKFVSSLYGFPNDFNGTSETGYILFYRDIGNDQENGDNLPPAAADNETTNGEHARQNGNGTPRDNARQNGNGTPRSFVQ